MKKSILFSFVLLLSICVFAQIPNVELVEVHYDNENAGGVGSPKQDLIIASKFTYDMLIPYVSQNLKAIKVFIYNRPVGDTGIVKIYAGGTYSSPGELIYSSSPVHVDSNSWNIINLPSPFPILPSDLWIGFEALSGPSGRHSWAGCDSGPNNPEGQYIYFDSSWYKLTALGAAFTYNWNIRALIEVVTNVKSETSPPKFELYQNYPNPFNPSTTITYSLSHNSWTTFKVYNILGQEVAILINQEVQQGSHYLKFDPANLPGGIYFYKMEVRGNDGSSYSSIKKMILLK